MTSQMTERFSAPGATLVKLFGRPAQEAEAFGQRAARVRDIGVRSAMAMAVFMRALTLVSGLALALIYGLGGYLALQGQLDPGTVVTMALLLNRLYAPLTALATARLDVVTALVSFERVFEVLDIEPLIKEAEVTTPLPPGPLAVELSHVRFAYPSADQVSLASLEEVAVLDDRAGDEVLHGVSLRVEPGPDRGPRRPVRRRQVDHRLARAAPLRRGRRSSWRWAASTCATSPSTTSAPRWAWSPRTATCSTTRSAPTSPTRLRRPARTRSGTRCRAPGSTRLCGRCPTGSTRWWASAATGSPAASASGSRSPACSSRSRAS